MNRWSLASTVVLLLIAACGADTHEVGVGGETNWLAACESDATCTGAARCVCGVCSDDCTRDSECGAGIECRARDSALVIEACGMESEHGLCAPRERAPEDSILDASTQDAAEPNGADAAQDAEVVLDAQTLDADAPDAELVQTIDGLLTCRESYLALQAAIEALRLTHAACEIDEDCICTTVSHDCGSDCNAPIRAEDEAVFQAELEVVAGGYCGDEGRPAKCGNYDEDCGCAAGCVDNVCSYVALTSQR